MSKITDQIKETMESAAIAVVKSAATSLMTTALPCFLVY